jgi:hypothetical protein
MFLGTLEKRRLIEKCGFMKDSLIRRRLDPRGPSTFSQRTKFVPPSIRIQVYLIRSKEL